MIIAQALYKVFTFIMMALAARFLGVESFGQLSFGLSFIWIFLFLSDLGLSELFIRDIASNKNLIHRYVNNILTIKVFLSIAAYFIIVLLAYSFFWGAPKFWVILILGAGIQFDSFIYFFRCLFRARETMEFEAILMVFEAILKLTLVFLAIKSGIGISRVLLISLALLLVSAINFVVNLAIFIINYRQPILFKDTEFWFYLIKTAFPFALVYILSFINFRIDIIMISLMRGDVQAGWYNADYKLIEQILLIPITIAMVSLPVFSRISGELSGLKRVVKSVMPFVLSAGLISVLFFYAFGSWMVRVVYGEEFSGAVKYLYLLSWVLLPFFLKSLLEKMLLSLNKQFILFLVYCISAALHIFLNMLLIPKLGINGASLSTLIIEILTALVLILLVNNKIGVVSKPGPSFAINKAIAPEELIY